MILTEADKEIIVAAIKSAEKRTSGEIKVHIEVSNPVSSVENRTLEMFHVLNMHETQERNGVLIYVAVENRQFAIYGDEGINKKVPTDFWESTKQIIQGHFKQAQFAEGLKSGIDKAAEQLARFFPYRSDDKNELPDEITFS
jgi:uncharacterized membrane protein